MRGLAVKSTVVLLLSISAAFAFGGQKAQKTTTGQSQAGGASSKNNQSQASRTAADSSTYMIGPTDVLEVNVWKEADVSRTVTVRPDGKISLPLINDIQASGQTPMELGSNIAMMLRKFIKKPQVTVTVVSPNSQKVFVVGEVNRPGPIPLFPQMTALEAIASAGGPNQFADEKKIFVIRAEGAKQVRLGFNYQAAIKGDLRQNIVLIPGDTIVVP